MLRYEDSSCSLEEHSSSSMQSKGQARHVGVVYGWDKDCERDPDWAAAVQADPNQPFYHVLPDEGQS